MMRIGDKDYDSFANWGTSQGDEDWAWIDEQLDLFSRTHGGLWAGRTGFDGLIHCVEWQESGLRKDLRLWPNSTKQVVTIEITADSRSESFPIPFEEFRNVPQVHMERAFQVADICGSWSACSAQAPV